MLRKTVRSIDDTHAIKVNVKNISDNYFLDGIISGVTKESSIPDGRGGWWRCPKSSCTREFKSLENRNKHTLKVHAPTFKKAKERFAKKQLDRYIELLDVHYVPRMKKTIFAESEGETDNSNSQEDNAQLLLQLNQGKIDINEESNLEEYTIIHGEGVEPDNLLQACFVDIRDKVLGNKASADEKRIYITEKKERGSKRSKYFYPCFEAGCDYEGKTKASGAAKHVVSHDRFPSLLLSVLKTNLANTYSSITTKLANK